jgi:hypothetical protein
MILTLGSNLADPGIGFSQVKLDFYWFVELAFTQSIPQDVSL